MILATENPWVGLVVAAIMAPFTLGIALAAGNAWRTKKPRRLYRVVGALCYVLMMVGIAIWGYARAAGSVVAAAGILGLLGRSIVAVTHSRKARSRASL